MALTSNIFVGITAWAPSTGYSVGNRRSNGGNGYQCIKAGTSASSGGPTGTGTSITDGGAIWSYLASVDYVTVASWASGVPGTLSQPVVALIWNCGPITTTVGTAFFTLSGHTTTATNNITIKAAPGDSFRDVLASNYSQALFSGSSLGSSFVLPSSGSGGINYIEIDDANVILDGLQFIDPNSASGSTILRVGGAGSIIRNSIFDGYSQVGGASIFDIEAPSTTVANTLVLERMGAGDNAVTVYASEAIKLVESTFISLNKNTGNGFLLQAGASGSYVRDCAIFGYSVPLESGAAVAFDHCATDASSFGSGATDGGGNSTGLTASNVFVNASTDFRLKSLLAIGATDTTDVPSADDIAGHKRVAWNPGAWEYFIQASASPSLMTLRASGSASLTVVTNQAHGTGSLLALGIVGAAQQINRFSGSGRVMFMQVVATGVTRNSASALCNIGGNPFSGDFSSDFGPFYSFVNGGGTAAMTQPASAAVSLMTLSANGQISNAAIGSGTIMLVSAAGVVAQLGGIANIMSLSCIATAIPLLQFSGIVSLDFRASGLMTSGTSASGTAGLLALRCSASMGQQALASGLSTLFVLSGGGAIGASMSARGNILPLSCSANVVQVNDAAGVASFYVLAVQHPVPLLIAADADAFSGEFATDFGSGGAVLLAADGSGILLAADVWSPNIVSNTFGSGLATIPAPGCSAQAILDLVASGGGSIVTSSVINAAQNALVTGRANIPIVLAVGAALQQIFASATASFNRLSAVGVLGQGNGASAAVVLPSLRAAGIAGQQDLASGGLSLTFSARGNAATAWIAVSRATLNVLSAIGSASFALRANGTANIMFAAAGTLGQANIASGLATLGMSANGAANQSVSSAGSSALLALTSAGSAVQGRTANGTATVLTLSAAASALNTVNPAQATVSFFLLSGSGAAFLHPNIANGSGTITFSCNGTMMGEIEANALVQLQQIVAAHGKLWVTPVAYEEGDLVIAWEEDDRSVYWPE